MEYEVASPRYPLRRPRPCRRRRLLATGVTLPFPDTAQQRVREVECGEAESGPFLDRRSVSQNTC
jgi:hypothetical protein